VDVPELLKNCPSLRVVICQITIPREDTVSLYPILSDPRFIVLQDLMHPEASAVECERSANGQIGLWELADMIVEAWNSEIQPFSATSKMGL